METKRYRGHSVLVRHVGFNLRVYLDGNFIFASQHLAGLDRRIKDWIDRNLQLGSKHPASRKQHAD